MNLWKWLLTLGTLAALVMVGTLWQTLRRLRLENQTLRAAGGAAEVPPVDPEQLRQQDDELARGRETTRALARARNEIRQWRGQKTELDQFRAANQRLVAARQAGTNAPRAGYVTGAALKDAHSVLRYSIAHMRDSYQDTMVCQVYNRPPYGHLGRRGIDIAIVVPVFDHM